jgi:hypothetical protein
MPGIFELQTPGGEPLGLTGPWQPAPAPALSFDAGAEPPPGIPVWRINLPEDEAEAEHALAGAEAQVALTEAELEKVPARLEQLSMALAETPQTTLPSFAAGLPGPEASMLALLAEARGVEQGRPVSYGMEGLGSAAWEKAQAQFQSFMGQIQREILNLAWVETNIGSQLVARTVVGWSGDNNTAWLEGATPDQREKHRRALDIAIKSRLQRLRIFTKVAGGAAKLSVLFATPAGTLLALPVAWGYVQEILQEIKNHQELTQGG